MARWFKSSDLKDSPVFWHRRAPIWLRVQVGFKSGLQTGRKSELQLLGSLPEADGKPVLLACCDEVYFYRFARDLAASAHRTSPGVHAHIHIYEPSSRCIHDAAELQRHLGAGMTVSYEPAGRSPYKSASPFFFTTARFAIADQILERNRTPVLVIDIDGVVCRDLEPEIRALGKCDVGLVLRPKQKRIWRRVLACAVLLNPTEEGRRFSARLATALERALRSAPRFHIDQIVIHYLCRYYRRHRENVRIADLGERWADHEFTPEGLIWTAKGSTRKLELAEKTDSLAGGTACSRNGLNESDSPARATRPRGL
ncbi:MAG TPA: hypothetical protein VJV39_19190 [Dongiaceae bacterium]|nr:hypothetical protein [Dongiaceae bacterium]